MSQGETHEVENQPPPIAEDNAYAADPALREALRREGGQAGEAKVEAFGAIAAGELREVGRQANENPPTPRIFDPYGHRIDEVEFHPAYHRSMAIAVEHGLHAHTWTAAERGAQVVRSALTYIHNQYEAGTMCPITMTHACVPALRHQPDVAEAWLPKILTDEYDPRCAPAGQKNGLTIGMGMTEKQGGSDVRANTTRAEPVSGGGPGREYELVGHKWFFSAPMCDAHLVLAQSGGGLSCFLVPKWRPDDSRNQVHIQRLKNKLGDRSNASSEVEFRGALGWMIGEEGRGVPTILDMVAQTRLDCMLGSAALVRQATLQAVHHSRHRRAFGKRLVEQPLMQAVLADLILEVEGAVALAMRVARAFDEAARGDEGGKNFARIATPIGKYWICKRAPVAVNEAQECLGGNGYVEDFILPRLYRQAPLNSIWEGSGNVQCLDVLRAMRRHPEAVDALRAELGAQRGKSADFDAHVDRLGRELSREDGAEPRARRTTEDLALALQASILLGGARPDIGEAFCRARLRPERGLAFGASGDELLAADLLERAPAR